MKPIMMQRGYNMTFYFVERDVSDSADLIVELKLAEKNAKFEWSRKTAYELNSGAVIALEMDSENDKILDFGIMSDGNLGYK